MRFAVFDETKDGETRVALVPDAVKMLLKKQHAVSVQSGAGRAASIPDAQFADAGAQIAADAAGLAAVADCLLRVRPVTTGEAAGFPEGNAVIGFLAPLRNPELVSVLAARRITAFSLDAIPRISRAQSMDTLSSMATIAGYKAVLLAADALPKFLPMLTTAAGTIRPSQALILGAGVAGLQAIATARRMGAVVEAFDVRAAVKEQIQSLGATFLEIPNQENLEDKGGYAKQVSPETLAKTAAAFARARQGGGFHHHHRASARQTGPAPDHQGNGRGHETRLGHRGPGGGERRQLRIDAGGKTVCEHGVTIIGPTNLPARMPLDASRMFARNLANFILEITNEKGFTMDWKNEIFAATCVTHGGEITRKAP